MSDDAGTTFDASERCGDCSPFVMLCPGEFDALVEQHGLDRDEQWAVLRLATLVNYKTGEMRISLQSRDADGREDGLTHLLGWHREKTSQVLDRLGSLGVVAFHFPRGHLGWIALLVYLNIVRVKGEKQARAIAGTLRKRREAFECRAAQSAETPRSEAETSRPPQRGATEAQRQGSAEQAASSQGGGSAERPRETPDSLDREPAFSPSASEGSGGGPSFGTRDRAVGEEARSSRARGQISPTAAFDADLIGGVS